MANLDEVSFWETGIYQLEVGDPVTGGADGISNTQGRQLANRTTYLKDELATTNSNLSNTQASVANLGSDVTDAENDILSIRTDINDMQANKLMNGMEAEIFFFGMFC